MSRVLALSLSTVLLAVAAAAESEHHPAGTTINGVAYPPPGFTALFNGHDLTGWHGWDIHERGMSPQKLASLSMVDRTAKIAAWTADAAKHWHVENGELVNDGKGPYLTTDKDYGDIELLIEYKIVPKADSGIYLRATPQVQIWDTTLPDYFKHGADKGSGGLWNNSPGHAGQRPARPRRQAVRRMEPVPHHPGRRADDDLPQRQAGRRPRPDGKLLEGPQEARSSAPGRSCCRRTAAKKSAGGTCIVREIPSTEANQILANHGDEGFRSLFNGHDLSGWEGPAVNEYEVKDGAIVCKPHKGGNLYTKDEFGDFVVRMEYKLPPGGNNGLLLRYPAGKKSDGAYNGMTEIQVLDDTAPQYAKLDPRQYNGSAYGMVAAHRGYLRPVGEWNFEEVTVKGPTIKVELNGTLILDCDLSKVTEYKDNARAPGQGPQRPAGWPSPGTTTRWRSGMSKSSLGLTVSRHVPRNDRWFPHGPVEHRSLDGLRVFFERGAWWAEVAYRLTAAEGTDDPASSEKQSDRLGPFKRPRNAMVEAERHATFLQRRYSDRVVLGD